MSDTFVIMKEQHVGKGIPAGENAIGNNQTVYNSRAEAKPDAISLSKNNPMIAYCVVERGKMFPDCLRDVYIKGVKVPFIVFGKGNTLNWKINWENVNLSANESVIE